MVFANSGALSSEYNRADDSRDANIRATLRFNTYDFGLLIADMTNFGPAGLGINDRGLVD